MRVANRVKTISFKDRLFYIFLLEGKFWGVESHKIKNGHLSETLNGLQGHISDTVEECEAKIRTQIAVDFLVNEKGMTPIEASIAVVVNREEMED